MIDVTNVFGKSNGEESLQKPFQFRRRLSPPTLWRRTEQTPGSSKPEDERSESGSSTQSRRSSGAAEEVVSPESVMKHPLENTWTLWYFQPDKNISWEQSQKMVCNISTCEDFWSLYNHIANASDLLVGSDYSLFKEGIRPMWEDAANKDGGRWLVNLDSRGRQKNKQIDKYWLEILLCMIGEAFGDNGDDVCGAVCNIRHRNDKLAVWTANAAKEDQIMDIGRLLKERLNLTSLVQLEYMSHRDSSHKGKRPCKSLLKL